MGWLPCVSMDAIHIVFIRFPLYALFFYSNYTINSLYLWLEVSLCWYLNEFAFWLELVPPRAMTT